MKTVARLLAGVALAGAVGNPVPAAAETCNPDIFLEARRYATVTQPSAAAIADFNGDTFPDIAVVGAGGLSVLLGHGDGTFDDPILTNDYAGATIAAGDFDGDGNMDVAAGYTDVVVVWLGKGDGTFQPVAVYPAPGASEALILADLNADGHLDIVAAMGGASLWVLLGNPNGTFQDAIAAPVGAYSVAAGDVDGDGTLDLVAATDVVSILHGLGDGHFDPPPSSIDVGPGLSAVALADVNNDGKLDIGVARGQSLPFADGWVGILIGDGHGAFQASVESFIGTRATDLILQDLDGDGNIDAAVHLGYRNNGTSYIGVLRGNGSATFSTATQYLGGEGSRSIAAGDLNLDGQTDLVSPNNVSSDITVFLANGRATYRALSSWEPADGPGVVLAPGDFDGDGVTDLVASYGDTSMDFRAGVGDGTFRQPVPIPNALLHQGVFAADFNGDGILDLAIGTWSPLRTDILLGNGDGSFRAFLADFDLAAYAQADFNGDGIPDLLAMGGTLGFDILVAFGVGDGFFGGPVTTPRSDAMANATPYDINRDGKADLAFTQRDGTSFVETVHVLIGNGNGTFVETYAHESGSNPGLPAFAEVTGDSHADLLVPSGADGLLLFAGNGDGTFQDPVTLDPQYCASVVASDVDGDGVIDLLTVNFNPAGGKLLLGVAGGGLQPPIPLGIPGGLGVAAVPFSGSAPDFLITADDRFSILRNSRLAPSVGSRHANVSTPAILKAAASGFGALTYQWRKNGAPLSDGGTISGASTATLTIDPADFGDAGSYDVLVTDSCATVDSNVAALAIEFADVPASSGYHDSILKIATAGITAGCGGPDYCPASIVTRAQMAVFLLTSSFGATYRPPPAVGIFDDVPVGSFAAAWIEDLYNRGVTGGCSTSPLLYCPDSSATRAQMAVFLLAASLGTDHVPSPPIGIFDDVPVDAFAAAWIEDLYNRSITGGCSASPLLYCPDSAVTREQMAPLLVQTFAIP